MGSLGRGAAPEMQDYRINWNVGPLGLVLRADLGADMPPVVAQVLPGESVASLAGVAVGDLLVSINGKRTAKLGYDKAMRLLYKQRLPITLHFRIAQLPTPAMLQQQQQQQHAMALAATAASSSSSAAAALHHSSSYAQSRRGTATTMTNLNGTMLSTRSGRSMSLRSIASDATATTREQKLRKQFSVVWESGSLGFSFRAYAPDVDVPTVDFIGSRGQGDRMDEVCINDVLIAINGEKTRDLGVERVLKMLLVLDKPVVLRFHKSSHRIEPSPPPRARARSNGTRLEPLPERESEPLGVVQEEDEDEPPPQAVRDALEGEIQLRSEQPYSSLSEEQLSSAEPTSPAFGAAAAGGGAAMDADPESEPEQPTQPISIATDFSASKRVPTPPSIPLHDAREIVARSTGKTVETCQFGGLPLTEIREGTMQARLLLTFAKACLAKQEAQEQHQQQPQHYEQPTSQSQSQLHHHHLHSRPASVAPGNALASGSSRYLAYSFRHDGGHVSSRHDDAEPRRPSAEWQQSRYNGNTGLSQLQLPPASSGLTAVDTAQRPPTEDNQAPRDEDTPLLPHFAEISSRVPPRVSHVTQGMIPLDATFKRESDDKSSHPSNAKDKEPESERSVDRRRRTPSEPEDAWRAHADHPIVQQLCRSRDVESVLIGRSVDMIVKKTHVVAEIQDILNSLEMELQFERHSHVGFGQAGTQPPPPVSRCFQCGKTGELATLALDGTRREQYCQECWELFFFSEQQQQQQTPPAAAAPTGAAPVPSRGSSPESPDLDPYEYSLHDSTVSISDAFAPWQHLRIDADSASERDSSVTMSSSITEHTDEVWL